MSIGYVSRFYRGGCWRNVPLHARVADRYGGTPGVRDYRLGFRLMRRAP